MLMSCLLICPCLIIMPDSVLLLKFTIVAVMLKVPTGLGFISYSPNWFVVALLVVPSIAIVAPATNVWPAELVIIPFKAVVVFDGSIIILFTL